MFQIRFWVPTILVSIVSLVIAAPDYQRLDQYPYPDSESANLVLEAQILDPFSSLSEKAAKVDADEGVREHLLKRQYRIAVPLVGNLLGLSFKELLIAQQILTVLAVQLSILLAFRISNHYWCSIMLGACFAWSFPIQWSFNDMSYFDGFAYFSLIALLYTRNPLLLVGITVFGVFTDERVVFALPLCMLFHVLSDKKTFELSISDYFHSSAVWAISCGLVIALIQRLLLGSFLGDYANTKGVFVTSWVITNVLLAPLSLLLVLKANTMLVLIAGRAVWNSGNRTMFTLFFISALLPVMVGIMVYDLSRSVGYVFPIVFVSSLVLSFVYKASEYKEVLGWFVAINIIFPSYYIVAHKLYVLLPAIRYF